jgi:hypothetical protein
MTGNARAVRYHGCAGGRESRGAGRSVVVEVSRVLPFSKAEFFAVFSAYNSAVWPAQLVLYLLAGAMVALAARRPRGAPCAIGVGLALVWIWTGVAYHLWHFTAVNRLAWGFGALFVIQGGLFLANAVREPALEVRSLGGWSGWIGGLLVSYALIVYPLLGLSGHPAREVPTLGVPCPTTIFTIGLLFWVARPLPLRLLVIPLLWAFVGSSAVILLGVVQDVGLLASGLLGLFLLRSARGGELVEETGR